MEREAAVKTPKVRKRLNLIGRSAVALAVAVTAGAIAAEEVGVYDTSTPAGSASHLVLDSIPDSFSNLKDFLPKPKGAKAQPVNLDSGSSNQSQDNQTGRREPRTINDSFKDIAELEPAFGGMFYKNGSLNVYLKDVSRGESARSAISSAFGQERVNSANISILHANYSYSELESMQAKARALFGLSGVLKINIDHETNKLEIGLADLQNTEGVTRSLSNLGIQLDAVKFTKTEPIQVQTKLTNDVRPVKGGLEIQHLINSTQYLICTHGFSVELNDTYGLLTAAHCSTTQAQPEGSNFSQASVANENNLIATEAIDPPFTNCPTPPHLCTNTDTEFAQYLNGVNFDPGKIARTKSVNNPLSPTNLEISGDWHITAAEDALPGEIVNIEGRTTGWEQGTVTAVCVDENMVTYVVLCQTEASYKSGAGDSGAPVFKIVNLATGEVTASGTLWGGKGNGGPCPSGCTGQLTSTGVYSPVLASRNVNTHSNCNIPRDPSSYTNTGPRSRWVYRTTRGKFIYSAIRSITRRKRPHTV